ncbi:MAG: TonB-dependent receptor, partial [Leptospiraceae bacterium]|nr:TonB-dependent receptor [Leptospiraceae bacterium]
SSHKGFEFTGSFDFGKFFETSMEIPLDLIYSHINAKNESYEKYPHVINSEGQIKFINRPMFLIDQNGNIINADTNGRYLPYVPEDTYTAALGLRMKNGFYMRAEYQYVAKQYASLSAYRNLKPGDLEIKEVNGVTYANVWNTIDETPDGNTGMIPSYGLLNASIGFKHPTQKWSIFLVGKNLQNRIYISGRLPIGIHPGPTRQVNFGVSFEI